MPRKPDEEEDIEDTSDEEESGDTDASDADSQGNLKDYVVEDEEASESDYEPSESDEDVIAEKKGHRGKLQTPTVINNYYYYYTGIPAGVSIPANKTPVPREPTQNSNTDGHPASVQNGN